MALGLIAALATTACVIEGTDDDKVDSGAGGSGDGGPTDPGDDAGPDGSGGSGGGGGVELPDDFSEDCANKGGNTSRDKALAFGKSVQICIEKGRESWFKVTAPDEGGAYLLALTYEQDAEVAFRVKAFAGDDNSEFLDRSGQHANLGTSGHFAVTVGAGTTTYFQFENYLLDPGLAKLSLEVTKENDAYEPNNSRDDAVEIDLNEDIHGQIWIPYVSASNKNSDDWFKVDLEEGDVTVKLTKVPENLRFGIEVQDPTFSSISGIVYWTDNPGALYEKTLTVKNAGTHYFRVSDYYSDSAGPAFWNKKPKSLSEQYTMRIEQ